jgi:hypothetical protein
VFDEMGDSALSAERGDLTHWFRAADKTSDLVGQRQASTFQTLAALAGHGELPSTRGRATKKTVAGPGGVDTKAKVNTRPQVRIRSLSRLSSEWECWALFEDVSLNEQERRPITRNDHALTSIAELYGLTIF